VVTRLLFAIKPRVRAVKNEQKTLSRRKRGKLKLHHVSLAIIVANVGEGVWCRRVGDT